LEYKLENVIQNTTVVTLQIFVRMHNLKLAKVMGWYTASCKMLLFCTRTTVRDSYIYMLSS